MANWRPTCAAALPIAARGAQRSEPLAEPGDPVWRCRCDRAARPFHRQPRDHPRPGNQNVAREALDDQGVARCVLDYKGRHREVMGGRTWTELFFLDKAVALAAGHRPCFFCRRRDAEAFRAAWAKAKGGKTPLAPEMDVVLHEERLDRARKRAHAIPGPIGELPDGAVISAVGEAYTI